ncbi:MAG TPA: YciI family protein [Bordetella sp.]|nr:YciI family protein [Bordetella sp.]
MRFMIIVKATADTEAGRLPDEAASAEMAAYHQALAQAGALLDAAGLQPSSAGWRIRYADGQRSVIDGPSAETRELMAGYTVIQARTREEALEWTRRFPMPKGAGVQAEIEVRPLYEFADVSNCLTPGNTQP